MSQEFIFSLILSTLYIAPIVYIFGKRLIISQLPF